MKKAVLFFMMALCLSSCMYDVAGEPRIDVREKLADCVIFMHSPTCSRSIAAKRYISEKYPNAKIFFLDLDQGDVDYIKSAQYYYGIGKSFSTPIICFGNNYIEGWDYRDEEKVDRYIVPYLK